MRKPGALILKACADRPAQRRKKKLSETYLHQIFILLSQIFHFLGKKFRCNRPELPSVTSPVKAQIPQPPEGRELKKLEEHLIKSAQEGELTSLGVLLSGCSGIRIGELCALQWKDIDLEKESIIVRKTMQRIRTFSSADEAGMAGKTGTRVIITAPKSRNSIREIPLPGFLVELLKTARKSGQISEEGYLLKGIRKEYTEPRTLQYRFQENPEKNWGSQASISICCAIFLPQTVFPRDLT